MHSSLLRQAEIPAAPPAQSLPQQVPPRNQQQATAKKPATHVLHECYGRITSYNVCYTKLLRRDQGYMVLEVKKNLRLSRKLSWMK